MSLKDRVLADPELLAYARAEFAKTAMTINPNLRTAAIFGLGSAAGGAVGAVLSGEMVEAFEKGKARLTKGKNFRRMMEVNPDLGQLDQKQVGLAFDTINRFAPAFARDPLVAGTWTRQIAGYGEGVPADRAAQLVQATSNLMKSKQTGAKMNPFIDAMTFEQKERSEDNRHIEALERARTAHTGGS
jgi:hypothetical protein